MKLLEKVYKQSDISWFTPVELFKVKCLWIDSLVFSLISLHLLYLSYFIMPIISCSLGMLMGLQKLYCVPQISQFH